MPFEDRRQFPRLVLSLEDAYFGNFYLPDQEKIIAPILNLSAGGLNMTVAREAKAKIKEGDALILKSIVGGTQLAFLNDIKAKIRWIKEEDNKIFIGCEFDALPENVLLQLINFVSSERMTRGQYD